MGKIHIGINLEFVRHEDKNFEWGVARPPNWAMSTSSRWFTGAASSSARPAISTASRCLTTRCASRRACAGAGVKLSGLSAHTPLCKPEIGVEYLKQAIRFAAECGAPVVNTDEGPKQAWTTQEEDHALMRYTLMEAAKVAEPRGILIGLEPHQQYSKSPAGLDRIYRLVKSPSIGMNFDTGNSYLSGHDPCRWLARIVGRLVHLHAKDISLEQSDAERGKVTGTPVGCACGDGVVDWARVIAICKRARRDIVLSVECGTVGQAERSIAYLQGLV